ncbi:trihelix transcription factor DF1-like [Magnolia sinica]|uniref:trihelix transcription factor DF1-like n=1 Tax=Magnolia sinica TaxID=86752 RepID=UPI002658AB78|nr:trihelix transcription factor DF1-like [Magnolia sinica]
MNTDKKSQPPALAMICLPAKQEQPAQRNNKPENQTSADFPISARPLQSVPPSSKLRDDGGTENGAAEEEKKREREHKRRSKNWTRIETQKLIRFRSELEPRFSRSGRKSELWDEISELLRGESISRDAQQCRDKWEKLTAGYKEVRDGVRSKEDYPFYDNLDPILSVRSHRRESQRVEIGDAGSDDEDTEDAADVTARKRRRPSSNGDGTVEALKDVVESLIAKQHRFFIDLLESMERREKIRERIRQEREEKWREEDRAQWLVFQNAMILLTKKLVGEGNVRSVSDPATGITPEPATMAGGVSKKRSKNWKRAEVLLLIKLRTEMGGRFAKSTRRAALWDELAGLMCAEGVRRDGKQCREKWDKLMAEFKDVSDGKRDRGDSPYFADLLARGSGTLDNPTAAVE